MIVRKDNLVWLGLILIVFGSSCKSSTNVESIPPTLIQKSTSNIKEKPELDYEIALWKEIINTPKLL